MGEHRERVDKRMSAQFNRRVLIPLALNLGARYIRDPYLGSYDDDEKTLHWGLGHKAHGDKRHRTRVSYVGIYYGDGGSHEGQTREIVTDRRLAWARKARQPDWRRTTRHTARRKCPTDESYDRIRTFSSLDLIQRFSASGSGEIAGIGGTVSSSTEARVHSELETEQYNKRKTERVIDTSAHLHYPGPVYRDDYRTRTDVQGNTYREIVGTYAGSGRPDLAHPVPDRDHPDSHPDYGMGDMGREDRPQHRGLGRQLRDHAERRARQRAGIQRRQRADLLHAGRLGAALQDGSRNCG